LLLADADVAGAKAVAERIRQITAASTFQVDEEVCTLFANCGVCEVLMEDTVPEILSRLQECIEHGKTAGRNHTVFDEGQGPVLCDSAPVDVKGRTIEVSGN
jgi:PleD family two-component response regulator